MNATTSQTPAHLNEEQRDFFEANGYLVVPNVLNESEIAYFTRVVDGLAADDRAQQGAAPDSSVEIRNAIARSDELLPLLDWPATFPLMAQIMGWNIQLTTSHVFVRMPTPQEESAFKSIGWHADGPNPPFPEINGVRPRMYAKIGYFLSDLSEPNRGNLRVIPGSHLRAQKPESDPATGEPEGAIQVLTRPGDAVFFEQRTWHAVGPNYADFPRKNIYIGYCYRYLKAIDFTLQSPELIEKANPIQRQLLGHATHELSFYLPDRAPEDVPLRAWLEDHLRG